MFSGEQPSEKASVQPSPRTRFRRLHLNLNLSFICMENPPPKKHSTLLILLQVLEKKKSRSILNWFSKDDFSATFAPLFPKR